MSVNLRSTHFGPLLLVEILVQPIRLLKNKRSVFLRWKFIYRIRHVLVWNNKKSSIFFLRYCDVYRSIKLVHRTIVLCADYYAIFKWKSILIKKLIFPPGHDECSFFVESDCRVLIQHFERFPSTCKKIKSVKFSCSASQGPTS